MRTSAFKGILVITLSMSLLGLGCSASNTVKGGAIGAAAGGALGAVIGTQAGNTAVGAIIGAVVGGTAGALIGNYMDRQAAEMQKDLEGAKIERIGEGIKITFDSGILFDVNSSTLKEDARTNIAKLSTILKKYSDTNILVEGHTDSDGTDAYNQALSERRAASVSGFAKEQGVVGGRFTAVGYGESQPVASNETVDGKAKNRRVDIAIFANEDLKEAAEKGKLK